MLKLSSVQHHKNYWLAEHPINTLARKELTICSVVILVVEYLVLTEISNKKTTFITFK